MFSRAVLIARKLFFPRKTNVLHVNSLEPYLQALIQKSRWDMTQKSLQIEWKRLFLNFITISTKNRSLIKAIDSVGDPPLPIPNRDVKLNSADGTANFCGRVGHRHFFSREFQAIETLFFLYMPLIPPYQLWPLVLQMLYKSGDCHFFSRGRERKFWASFFVCIPSHCHPERMWGIS